MEDTVGSVRQKSIETTCCNNNATAKLHQHISNRNILFEIFHCCQPSNVDLQATLCTTTLKVLMTLRWARSILRTASFGTYAAPNCARLLHLHYLHLSMYRRKPSSVIVSAQAGVRSGSEP